MLKKDYQVDMHIHTTASDGTWTAEEVVFCQEKGQIKHNKSTFETVN